MERSSLGKIRCTFRELKLTAKHKHRELDKRSTVGPRVKLRALQVMGMHVRDLVSGAAGSDKMRQY